MMDRLGRRRRRQPVDWDAEPGLGVLSDDVLAQRYGVHKTSVGVARRARGIAPCRLARWTPAEDARLVACWERGVAAAATALGRSQQAVLSRARDLKLGPVSRGTWTVRSLADYLGVDPRTVLRLLRDAGVKPERSPTPGRRRWALTVEQVEAAEARLLDELGRRR